MLKWCFDSILVRLKAVLANAPNVCWKCFDSILVRLKVIVSKISRRSLCLFRFHTGSIKSQADPHESSVELCFDSILVRLKAVFAADSTKLSFRFDSILVRLKAVPRPPGNATIVCFDSILVRLKDSFMDVITVYFVSVSIPYWFD